MAHIPYTYTPKQENSQTERKNKWEGAMWPPSTTYLPEKENNLENKNKSQQENCSYSHVAEAGTYNHQGCNVKHDESQIFSSLFPRPCTILSIASHTAASEKWRYL